MFLETCKRVSASGNSLTLNLTKELRQLGLDRGDAAGVKFEISWVRFGLMIAVSFAYALLMDTLGYTLSTFLFLIAILKLARAGSWVKVTIISLICSVAFYVLFKVALGVMLPGGFLGF